MTKNKRIILIASLSLLTILLWLSALIPLPYYIESPGGAADIRQVLQVNGEEDTADGSYNFVYINVQQATAIQLLFAAFDSHKDIYPESMVTGGANNEDYYRINQFFMETSQNLAKYQGLTLAGKEVNLDFFGVYVLSIADNSTFKQSLHLADTVTSVNGQTFESSSELVSYVNSLDLGSQVTVGFISEQVEQEATGTIIKLDNGKNGIGITLTDHTEVTSSEQIEFQTGSIGGPSAGLMFTLAIYTQLAEPDLRDGRMIAGTGTIEKDGKVGDIGGAGKKVLSAYQAGASVFFVPDNPVDQAVLEVDPTAKTNYEEAKEMVDKEGLDIELVPVKTVQEAIDYLRRTKG